VVLFQDEYTYVLKAMLGYYGVPDNGAGMSAGSI
jgi:hypothetical protein